MNKITEEHIAYGTTIGVLLAGLSAYLVSPLYGHLFEKINGLFILVGAVYLLVYCYRLFFQSEGYGIFCKELEKNEYRADRDGEDRDIIFNIFLTYQHGMPYLVLTLLLSFFLSGFVLSHLFIFPNSYFIPALLGLCTGYLFFLAVKVLIFDLAQRIMKIDNNLYFLNMVIPMKDIKHCEIVPAPHEILPFTKSKNLVNIYINKSIMLTHSITRERAEDIIVDLGVKL